jgi:hypothetical protein
MEHEPSPDAEADVLAYVEEEAAEEVPSLAPSSGLQDSAWTPDDWQGLLDRLVQLGLVTWPEVAALVLGQLNPPQVGTAIASSASFQQNFVPGEYDSIMRAVMHWFYGEGGRCTTCGTRLDLQADHIDPRQNYANPADADRIENLTLRCRRHNVTRRPSHVFGGLTFLTAEAALMWILLTIRPRTLLDFVRLCRIYGMTMADVRMQEAWAMAHWLSHDPTIQYEIEDDQTYRYTLLLWPDGSLTRRRTSDEQAENEPTPLYDDVPGDAIIAFVTSNGAGEFRLHEMAISTIPFSTYDLGARPPSALAVLPTPPDRVSGTMPPLRALPPRGLRVRGYTIRSTEQRTRVEYVRNGATRTVEGPASVRGKRVPLSEDSIFSVITVNP